MGNEASICNNDASELDIKLLESPIPAPPPAAAAAAAAAPSQKASSDKGWITACDQFKSDLRILCYLGGINVLVE